MTDPIPTFGGEQFNGVSYGAPCQFPFFWGNVSYHSCIVNFTETNNVTSAGPPVNHGQPWCLTDPVNLQAEVRVSTPRPCPLCPVSQRLA